MLLTVVIKILIIVPQLVFKPLFMGVLSDVFPAVFSYFNWHAYFSEIIGAAELKIPIVYMSLSPQERFYLLYSAFLIISQKYSKIF